MRLEFISQFEERIHLRRLVGLYPPLSPVYGHLPVVRMADEPPWYSSGVSFRARAREGRHHR
jgi:hypothetical protein